MPRRQGPPDAMTAAYGQKSEHVRIRMTAYEMDLMTRACRHGGFESQSQFIRSAIAMLAEQTLNGPTAVERQIFAQEELTTAVPAMTPPEPLGAEPEPVEYTPEVPSLQQLLNVGLQGGGPVEAPLDFDDGGWIG